MCGIAGVIASDSGSDVTTVVSSLTAALAHRGPDGSGIHYLRHRAAALGHRRLSIVDLECGAQPMTNEDERIWVVCNGELYNHLDLRRTLESLGHRFRTRSDVEALVHGWEEWGPGVLERLNGIYAFALYDGRTSPGTVWLARDPLGVKPLYVGHTDRRWWFTSELAAARRCGLLNAGLRPAAFEEYLVYRFVPSPGTFFVNAWKLPPGHLCQLPLDTAATGMPRFQAFTTRFDPPVVPRSGSEWAEAIRSSLHGAVRRQLMSDVPVGTLLSGGVDSTIVSGVMRELLPEPPAAFAAGFTDAPDGGELPYARQAAATMGLPLHEVAVREADYLDAWPRQVSSLAEPIANSGVLLVGLLCRSVGRHCKVVLSGQGADEPLGGYPRHVAERLYPVARMLRPLSGALRWFGGVPDDVRRMLRVSAEADEARRFTTIMSVFSPDEALDLTGHGADGDALADPVRRWLPADGERDGVNRLLHVDARLSLADDLLLVADHTSMAASVELRVPFLDLELLALIERMPSRYKVAWNGARKWLYRDAISGWLPASLRSRLVGWRAGVERKLGFTTPLEGWLSSWVATSAREFLLGPGARGVDFLRRDRLSALVARIQRHPRAYRRQWISLFVLEQWLRHHA